MTAALAPDIDWLAVEFVCNGTPMNLHDDPPTLEAAILQIGHGLTVQQISERCGTHRKRVSTVLREHGARKCLICARYLLSENGITPRHCLPNRVTCEMSGFPIGDTVRAGLIRSTNRKLLRLG